MYVGGFLRRGRCRSLSVRHHSLKFIKQALTHKSCSTKSQFNDKWRYNKRPICQRLFTTAGHVPCLMCHISLNQPIYKRISMLVLYSVSILVGCTVIFTLRGFGFEKAASESCEFCAKVRNENIFHSNILNFIWSTQDWTIFMLKFGVCTFHVVCWLRVCPQLISFEHNKDTKTFAVIWRQHDVITEIFQQRNMKIKSYQTFRVL